MNVLAGWHAGGAVTGRASVARVSVDWAPCRNEFGEFKILTREPASGLPRQDGIDAVRWVGAASRSTPGDCPIEDFQGAGLGLPCIIRPKFFTLDNRLILRKTGALGAEDAGRARELLRSVLGLG